MRTDVAKAIERTVRLRPLDLLSRYLQGGSLAVFDPVLGRSPGLYAQVKEAADYGSDCVDGHEVFYFNRQRKYRQRRYEFAFRFHADEGEIRHDEIAVAWCEIPLDELLIQCSAMSDPGMREYAIYLYDDAYLQHGSVLFGNGRMMDFVASANGERFVVAILYGQREGDVQRAMDLRSRMVKLGSTQHT